MKRTLVLLMLIAAAGLPAQDATIIYVDGDVDVRKESGSTFMADFGDQLGAGDRVLTLRTGTAELELATGGVVNVAPDTVFIIGSATGPAGERTGRISAAVGSFAFRFNAVVGNEPRIGSTTSVAGVRGTEVRVFVGSDGTTRYEVLEGLVEIEGSGERVALGPEQAVEITPGVGPGTIFAFLQQPIDYSVWNAGLVENFLDDPLPALRGIASEMEDLVAEIERIGPGVDAMLDRVREENAKLPKIEEESGREARQEYFEKTVMPLRRDVRAEFVDFRFVVLSALSLDQYVISRMAAEMEARYFFDPESEVNLRFREELRLIRSLYERVVVPRLVPSDI